MCDARRGRKNKSSLGTGGERETSRLKKRMLSKRFVKKRADPESFPGPGFQSNMGQDSSTGSRCPPKNKFETSVRGYRRFWNFLTEVCAAFHNWIFRHLRKKNYQQKNLIGPISLVQHEQFSKSKYSKTYSELVVLFFSKTYQTFEPDVFSSISMVCN